MCYKDRRTEDVNEKIGDLIVGTSEENVLFTWLDQCHENHVREDS